MFEIESGLGARPEDIKHITGVDAGNSPAVKLSAILLHGETNSRRPCLAIQSDTIDA